VPEASDTSVTAIDHAPAHALLLPLPAHLSSGLLVRVRLVCHGSERGKEGQVEVAVGVSSKSQKAPGHTPHRTVPGGARTHIPTNTKQTENQTNTKTAYRLH
jgi:hypothetical protein